MRKLLAGLMIGALAATFAFDVDAQRRFGGGRTFGKQSPQVQQRQATPQQQTPQQQQQTPQQATAAPAQQPAAAAAARSPWRGALMGVAAGLGIAALASYLGLSEALTMVLTAMLVGMAILLLLGFVLRRMRGTPQPAYATQRSAPGTYSHVGYETAPGPAPRTPVASGSVRPGSAMDQLMRGNGSGTPWGIPAGFDTKSFLGAAKANYARLQQAWDSGNLADLEEFTTNEMFIALTHDLHARRGSSRTEIVALDAELLGIESTVDEHMASVKFDGTLKVDGEVERVSEVWNLTKPARGGGWVLAGIQQLN